MVVATRIVRRRRLRAKTLEPAVLYLTWVRTIVPAVTGLALLATSMFVDIPGLRDVAVVTMVSGFVIGPMLLLAARRFGYLPVARLSIYVDLLIVALIVTQVDEGSTIIFGYLWPVAIAAMLLSPRETMLIGFLSALVAVGADASNGFSDGGLVALDPIAILVLAGLVSALRVNEHRANQALRELDALRDEFVASASHELRTPTSIVLGFASTLVDRWDELGDRERRRFVEEIDHAARRLSTLVEDVLQASQVESGDFHCAHAPFDLEEEVRDLARTWSGQHHVVVETVGDDHEHAFGDPTRTRQVLGNLFENADRATYDDSPIVVRVQRIGGQCVVDVVDHGQGIAPTDQDRIFERFVRLERDSIGTGLGLYISRRLAEAQGGSLDVTSAPGDGATFTFALPAADDGSGASGSG